MKHLFSKLGLVLALTAVSLHCGPLQGAAPLEVASFVGDFERGDLSGWSSEAARPDSIQVVRDPVRRGQFAARFTVRAGDEVSKGARAEIVHDNGDRAGSQGWYAWSFFIPQDYADTPWRPRLWQSLGQWHDQPDAERGENWDNFPGHSPSIALYYTFKAGVPAIEMWYGAKEQQDIVATAPITKGRWNDVVFHIGWSPREDGFAQAWLNGAPLTARDGEAQPVQGANMWNAAPHYLKIGLYRNPEITTENIVYFDEVRIGNCREEVAPSPVDRLKSRPNVSFRVPSGRRSCATRRIGLRHQHCGLVLDSSRRTAPPPRGHPE